LKQNTGSKKPDKQRNAKHISAEPAESEIITEAPSALLKEDADGMPVFTKRLSKSRPVFVGIVWISCGKHGFQHEEMRTPDCF
jgi:hypothetical protein